MNLPRDAWRSVLEMFTSVCSTVRLPHRSTHSPSVSGVCKSKASAVTTWTRSHAAQADCSCDLFQANTCTAIWWREAAKKCSRVSTRTVVAPGLFFSSLGYSLSVGSTAMPRQQ